LTKTAGPPAQTKKQRSKKMILQERTGFDNKPVYILSRDENITRDAIDSKNKPYLEQLKNHADAGGYFYTYSKDEVINGLVKIYASKDLFAINAKVNAQGPDTLYNQIWRANERQIKNAARKGTVEFI
jgi:hypothetical protein